MITSGKFISALLLSSALICAAIPSQSLQAQTVTVTKEAISDDLYCVTELVETSGSGIQPFSATQTKSGSKTQRYVNSSGATLWYVTVHAFFTYNGSTSSCTSTDVTAGSNSSAWKVLPINRVGNPEIPDMLLQQAPISFPIPKSLQLRVLFPFPVPKMGLYSKKKTVMHSDMHHGFST